MKILLVHNFYQQHGGEDAAALADKQLLEKNGEDVVFYTRHNDEIAKYGLKQKLVFPPESLYSLRTRRDVQEIIRSWVPDVAYIHNFFPLVSPSLYRTLKLLNIPAVQVVHDFRFLCANGWFYTQGKICERCKDGNYLHAVRYRCYRNSFVASLAASAVLGINRFAGLLENISAFICLTEFTKQKLLAVGIPENKLFVRPHSIETSQVEPLGDPGRYILYLGKLSGEKGLFTLIKAMNGLNKISLRIVGTGPLESELRGTCKQQGLKQYEFLGYKTGKEKVELLVIPFCGSAVGILQNLLLRINAIERTPSGRAVLGSNLGGLPSVIE